MLTPEQTLTRVLQVIHLLPEDDYRWYSYAKEHPGDKSGRLNIIGTQLFLLEQDLRRALAEQSASRSGNRTAFTAARRICQRAIDTQTHRPAHRGAWIDRDGKQCVCDGIRGFRLNSPFDLPKAPDPEPGVERMDLEQVIAPLRKNSLPLTLPTAAEVRSKIKIDRVAWNAQKPPKGAIFHAYYDFGPGLPKVNANYLLDYLYLFPKGLEAFASEQSPFLTPIYFKSPAGEGVLCTCRKTE